MCGTLNRKACGSRRKAQGTCRTCRDMKTASLSDSQAEQQHNVNSAGTSLLMAEKKAQGAHHCCFGQCCSDEQCPKKYKRIAFCLFPKPKQMLEDCKAWKRARGPPHDQILDQHTWSALARQGVELRLNRRKQGCVYLLYCLPAAQHPGGGRNSSVGSAWTRCSQRRGFDPPLGTFSVEGIFPLELTWVQTPFPQKLLRMRV